MVLHRSSVTFNRVLNSHPHTSMFWVDFVPTTQFRSLFVHWENRGVVHILEVKSWSDIGRLVRVGYACQNSGLEENLEKIQFEALLCYLWFLHRSRVTLSILQFGCIEFVISCCFRNVTRLICLQLLLWFLSKYVVNLLRCFPWFFPTWFMYK